MFLKAAKKSSEYWKKNKQSKNAATFAQAFCRKRNAMTPISEIKLLAFDLDGTLTQHKTPLSAENRAVLDALRKRYRLLMVGAGGCERIYRQLNEYPIDIIGNYGMQEAIYDTQMQTLRITEDAALPCFDRAAVEERVAALRQKYGYTDFRGGGVEYHPSGCITIPLLGTAAAPADKLSFDPDRKKRRAIYHEVKALFPEYTVFVGGSSSFDMAPFPFNKYYALDKYCAKLGIPHSAVAFVGDDYGPGGNDESVFLSDFSFVRIDDYRAFPTVMQPFLENNSGEESDR